MTENTPNKDRIELLKAVLVEATEYLKMASEANKRELERPDGFEDDDLWNLGSFCFLDDEDFVYGRVWFFDADEDSFESEFQDEWK